MFQISSPRLRFSFTLKCTAVLALIALADCLFYDKPAGATLGLFALIWAGVVALVVPAARMRHDAKVALACATGFALVLINSPSLLAWVLFWGALSSAVLLPLVRLDDAMQWGLRLFVHGLTGLGKGVRDILHLLRLPRPLLRHSAFQLSAMLALPLIGTTIFITLFSTANPLVERFLSEIPLPSWAWFSPLRCAFWIFVAVSVWPSLRPSRIAAKLNFSGIYKPMNLPGVNIRSIIISLALFNLIFAIQNGLDVAFLWSGAPLPKGVTMADYAHRGAYPLIITALLAGLFVLATARPDSAIGRNQTVRRLVVAWIAQNLVLVASSVVRTMDYIDAYMMTQLRLAALIWMGLVAVGLALICWRMMARLPLIWLINSMALVALVVLSLVSLTDLATLAAQWNVQHAREACGHGQPLDLAYLHRLGGSALVPLAELESAKLPPEFRDRLVFVRENVLKEVADKQKGLGWTWRNARRIDAAMAILGPSPSKSAPAPFGRRCDGTLVLPQAPKLAPLTQPGGQ